MKHILYLDVRKTRTTENIVNAIVNIENSIGQLTLTIDMTIKTIL